MSAKSSEAPRKFGTFGGVFTPCTLTILGVIMFLRYGQVVGNAGLFHALLIVAAAKTITTLTALSVSAIATNTKVKGGGAYYMISRSLGVEYGGAIGVVFFLAQAVSVSMYIVGFTEAFSAAFPDLASSPRLIGSVTNVLIFGCVLIGSSWAMKVQYVILVALVVSLGSFVWGAFDVASIDNLRANIASNYTGTETFFSMFALFFPAATGIMAGANMSGDLASPARSIPRGTLGAIAATAAVYVGLAVLLAASAERSALLDNPLIVKTLAASPALVTVGIFAATLSSAIGSMLGAPRVLQALARDRIFKRLGFLGAGSGASNEPRRATVLTFILAEAGILLGDLDLIAPIITMFFMVTYGCLNLATFYEAYTGNPSYRPTFRLTHWSLALAGTLACVAVMFLIEPLWAAASIVAMAGLFWYISRRRIKVTWGDVRSGAAYERARKDLLRLEDERYHPKNWRPNLLAFSGGAGHRVSLSEFGHWIAAGQGLYTLGQIITGDVDDLIERRTAQERVLRKFIRDEELSAFPAVVVATTREDGVAALIQCHGIGALRCNTALFGWTDDAERQADLLGSMQTVRRLGRSVLLVHEEQERPRWHVPDGTIDIWWRGKVNGHLMVLLAHLISRHDDWEGRELRLLRMLPTEDGCEEARRHLLELVEESRIRARVDVIVGTDAVATIRETSAGAALVFLGMLVPEAPDPEFFPRLAPLFSGLATVVFVASQGDVALEA